MGNAPESNQPSEREPSRNRLQRWKGIWGLGVARFIAGFRTAPRRTVMSVLGVALAIALLLLVTGLAIGMASPMAETADTADYWIVPESSGASSPLVATGGTQFGSVHETTGRLRAHEDVTYATPLLMQVLRVPTTDGGTEQVIALGIIPTDSSESVMSVSTGGLTPGDPYYANGSYNGEWTGEIVVSDGAATLLETAPGEPLPVSGTDSNQSVTVVAVDDGDGDGWLGATPIVVMHLSELQTITGADRHDQADQFLVRSTSSTVTSDFDDLYPQSEVLSSAELTTQQVLESDLAVALGLTAALVVVFVGSLFIVTTMALEVAADRAQLVTLAAIGVSRRSRIATYGAQTLLVSVIGGVIGIGLGMLAIPVANRGLQQFFAIETVVVSHPLLLGVGLAAAVCIGAVTVPFVALIQTRVEAEAGSGP